MYYFNTEQIVKKLGLDKDGRVQKVLDSQVVHYLRKTMPVDSYTMSSNTRIIEPGTIKIQTPYAHYQNEGIKYIMPDNGKSAFYSPAYGFWSKPNVKKVSSGEPLNYRGADRGSHFVERTIYGHYNDILEMCKKAVHK